MIWKTLKSMVMPPLTLLVGIEILVLCLGFPFAQEFLITSVLFIGALSVVCFVSQLIRSEAEFNSGAKVAVFSLVWYFLAFVLSAGASILLYPAKELEFPVLSVLRLEFMGSWYFWIIFILLLPCWIVSAFLLNSERHRE
jgi:hypothetical protein